MQENLSWGLIVCTYNRADFLLECLRHTLKQTRLPSEIVIVDASDYWQETFDKVSSTYAEHWKTIRLVYEPAKVRSIPYQRNQALDLSQADVVFSLDDDIYMQPDAAGVIMEAYDKDADEEIAMIGGHFIGAHPDEESVEVKQDEVSESRGGIVNYLKSHLEQGLTMQRHFVAYGKLVRNDEPPESVQGLGLFPSGLINGGRTTFRRHYGVQSRWSNLLRYYAAHEDSDFSYRMSDFGQILVAPRAGFFHADGAEDRPNRFKTNTIRVSNLMALHRVSSDNRLRSSWRLLMSFFYFMGLYLLIDPARKRYSLPVVRAYALGALLIPFFMFYPFRDFVAWYTERQERMYRAR